MRYRAFSWYDWLIGGAIVYWFVLRKKPCGCRRRPGSEMWTYGDGNRQFFEREECCRDERGEETDLPR